MVGSNLLLVLTTSFFAFVFTSNYALKFFVIWYKDFEEHETLHYTHYIYLATLHNQICQSYFAQLLLICLLKRSLAYASVPLFFEIWYLSLFLLLSRLLLVILPQFFKESKELQQLWNLSILMFVSVSCFIYVKNFLILIFVLELVNVVYYFFFLNFNFSDEESYVKYRNLLSLFLWNSFIVLCMSCLLNFILIFTSGTLDFAELGYVKNINFIIWQFILVTIFWKAGAPGFHFFKIEVYRYIPRHLVFIFSAYTLYFNYFILMFILFSFYPILVYNNYFMLVYLLIINIFLLMRANNGGSLYNFFAYSSVNTWASIALFALI